MSSAKGRLFSLGLNEIMCSCPSPQADISMQTWKYANTHPQALHTNTMTITPGAIPNTLSIHEMGFIPQKWLIPKVAEWISTTNFKLNNNCILDICWGGERFRHQRLQRKPLVNVPGMHHGTCVTHVPWCMPGSLIHGGGENVFGIPVACSTRNFTYLARGVDIYPTAQPSKESLAATNMVGNKHRVHYLIITTLF